MNLSLGHYSLERTVYIYISIVDTSSIIMEYGRTPYVGGKMAATLNVYKMHDMLKSLLYT